MTTRQQLLDLDRPPRSATAGRLDFTRGGSRVTLSADGAMRDLYRARFRGPPPNVRDDDGHVRIEYPLVTPSQWLRLDRRAADVALNPGVPWAIRFGHGVSRLSADLRGLELRSLQIDGGASDIELVLPEPKGAVSIRIRGGASAIAVRRPGSAAVRLRVGGGVSRLVFDDERFGAVGGEIRLETLGAETAANRYNLEIGGGASRLTVERIASGA
jgi:hypothetical protein